MTKRRILVDDTRRELSEHGTETFPMTVNHDDLWAFEGKRVPIHWHDDLEISLPREGEAIYQIYEKSYIVRPDFLYGDFGSDIERNCFRPFLENSAVPCIHLKGTDEGEKEILKLLNQVEEVFDRKVCCYELRIKGLLCEAFSMILSENRKSFSRFVPANQLELERLEKMLNYLNARFQEVISLQSLAEQVHLSREVCCRLFKKMTGKTVTGYLEEYRANKSFPLVQSGQYSMTQIADMVGFSSASRFASAFRKQFGCNPGEYNSLKKKKM